MTPRFLSLLARSAIRSAALLLCASTPMAAQADVDPGSLQLLSSDAEDSPVPRGLVVGGVALTYTPRYQGQDRPTYLIPGFVYFGQHLMYLGDRARYYFYRDGDFASFAYGRVRFGNLDPTDAPNLAGMDKRKAELEGGIGANLITPYALLMARAATDISGVSHGSELLLWSDFPIVRGRWLVMPGVGAMWRSNKMTQYYFGGVSPSEATATRPAYAPGTALSPMAALVTTYRMDRHWLGMLSFAYEHYDSKIAASPIVQHSGESTVLAGVGYTW